MAPSSLVKQSSLNLISRKYPSIKLISQERQISQANFQGEAHFNHSEFYSITYFSGRFNAETKFNYVLFEEEVIFDIERLSNVSFMNTDLTGVRFSDNARWGGKKVKEDKFKIVDERLLEEEINKENDGHTTKDFNLGSIKAVYRSLRENYEYRMRYDETRQFFIIEMELKRSETVKKGYRAKSFHNCLF